MSRRHFLKIILLSLLLAACSRSKDITFYLLNPLHPTEHFHHPAHSLTQIGMDDIEVPDYLEKLPLMIYQGPHQVSLNEDVQWAERVDKSIKRIIPANLSLLLPDAWIEYIPWDIKFKPQYYLRIQVTQFTIDSKGNSVLGANFVLTTAENTPLIKETKYYHAHIPEPTTEKLIASMNQHLSHFTEDIANKLKKVIRHY